MKARTVLAHGVFDVLHIGHLRYLKEARRYGERLIVSVTSDRFVNKGPGRPHFPAEVRAEMIRHLCFIDEVVISDYPTAIHMIERFKPDFYVKGPEYKDAAKDVTGGILAEKEAVESYGGKVVFTDTPVCSSSELLNRYLNNWTKSQREIIQEVRSLGGYGAVLKALTKIKEELDVCVIGECIMDIYRYVEPQGVASKHPCLSTRLISESIFGGGAWAIEAHLAEFCRVKLVESGITHKKIRYIDVNTGHRLFEVTDHPRELPIKELPPHNLLIVADFGHGLVNSIPKTDAFLALNVQTNSSNFGFNRFTKHSVFDYLVLDKRELELAYNDRTSDIEELAARAQLDTPGRVAVTAGSEGSIMIKSGEIIKCSAFADKVIDATGAGDAYFALTSLLVATKADPILTMFLGNVFAGLKTQIVGNKEPVSRASLLKACDALLR